MLMIPLLMWFALSPPPASPPSDAQIASPVPGQSLIVVVGAEGEEVYAPQFLQWGTRWLDAAKSAHVHCVTIGTERPGDASDLQNLETALSAQAREHPEPLWIVLIGHGTFDGRQAKFNLRGTDLTAEQLAQWLTPFRRTVVVVNCAAASSPFMGVLAGENRIVMTSTKSGYQYNFARFGEFLSLTIGDPQADLDKDGQISLLEAYLLASSRVDEFYRQEARLATEQALLDDNGDGRGTPASWFRGVRAVKKPQDDVLADGLRAHQLHLVRSQQEEHLPSELHARRDALERQLEVLRAAKLQLDADHYYEQLAPLMVDLARLYASSADPLPAGQ